MLKIVTTADLCEEADTILSMRFDGEHLYEDGGEGDVYCERAQWMFEDILSDLERGLVDKGYTFDGEVWRPTSFYIGDPALLLAPSDIEELLPDEGGASHGAVWLRAAEAQALYAYTHDGYYAVVSSSDDAKRIIIESGVIAIVPQDLALPEAEEYAARGLILPARPLDISVFLVNEDENTIVVGDLTLAG